MTTPAPQLTPRELEVLQLICTGMVGNRALAGQLCLSQWTVETHVRRIMAKFDATSRAELVVRAYSSGVVVVA